MRPGRPGKEKSPMIIPRCLYDYVAEGMKSDYEAMDDSGILEGDEFAVGTLQQCVSLLIGLFLISPEVASIILKKGKLLTQ